jgi:hypothetical protein
MERSAWRFEKETSVSVFRLPFCLRYLRYMSAIQQPQAMCQGVENRLRINFPGDVVYRRDGAK